MQIQLDNQQIIIHLSKEEFMHSGAYIERLLRSNKVAGTCKEDDVLNCFTIRAHGENEQIYCALLQIQEESMTEYYTI